MGPSGPGAEGESGENLTSQDTARLVEVCVYGIATLYERYPPRAKPEGTPSTPAQPGK